MEKNLYVECRLSKKGSPYFALMCDLGYRTVLVSYDRYLISELLDISLADLFSMSLGERYALCSFIKSK